jgi:hypothetical protein
MRWIEQAEARQVITMALFERAPKMPWSAVAGDAAANCSHGWARGSLHATRWAGRFRNRSPR